MLTQNRLYSLLIINVLFLLSVSSSAARLSIIIDDTAYRKQDIQVLMMPKAVSVAIFPDSPHGKENFRTSTPTKNRDTESHTTE